MVNKEVERLKHLGKLDEALQLIDDNLPQDPSELYFELYLQRIHILESQSKPSLASDLMEQILPQVEQQKDNSNLLFHYLLTKATTNVTLGQNHVAQQTLDRLSSMVGDGSISPYLISKYYTVQGNYNLKVGNITLALDFQRQGLKYVHMHDGLEDRKMVFWNNIAIILIYQGHFEDALEFLLKALAKGRQGPTIVEYENVFIMNIGRTYYYMHEFTLARTYLEDAIKKASKAGLYEKIAESLFYLILLDTEENARFPDSKYRRFMQIPHHDNPRFLLLRKFIQAFKARHGQRVKDMYQAQEQFREIIDHRIIDHQIYNMAILHFAELLFDEMDKFGVNEEIIEDLDTTLTRSIEASQQEHLYPIYTRALTLKAKIYLLQQDTISAIETFDEALTVAKAHGLLHISKMISKVYDQSLSVITSQITGHSKSDIDDLYQDIDPQLTLRIMRQFQSDTSHQAEEPMIFLIISPGMSLLYSLKFNNQIEADENLIGNFLTALNSFGEKIFQTKDSIQRIQIGEYTIIFKPFNNYLFSYTFKGPSYQAISKLDQFIDTLVDNDGFKSYLVSSNLILNESGLKQMVNGVFAS